MKIISGKEFCLDTRNGEVLTFYAQKRTFREAAAILYRGEAKASPKRIRFRDGSCAWLGKTRTFALLRYFGDAPQNESPIVGDSFSLMPA